MAHSERAGRWQAGSPATGACGCALTVDPLAAFAAGASRSWAGVALGRGAPGLTVTSCNLPVPGLCCAAYVLATGRFTAARSPGAWANCLAMGALVRRAGVWQRRLAGVD